MKKLLFILLFISCSATAAQSIHINALNYPVWAERNQSRIALSPGSALLNGDIVQTGAMGRAWLALPDGSVVKLGQDTRFEIRSAELQQQPQSAVLTAALNVIKGAFRFTSGFFASKFTSKHQVNIRIGAVTVGIRGTDIWGRSIAEEDFVALIEGNITAQSAADASVVLDQPLSRYLKKSSQAEAVVDTLSKPELEQLASETELAIEQGIANMDGRFELVLMSLTDPKSVAQMVKKFQHAGYALNIEPIVVNFEKFQRLKISGFVSRQAAKSLAAQLQQEFKLDSVWIKPVGF
ncbi:MAG: FecR domain-containing protein [Gammaproteobacteria bacterium]|nr:FecR domain-containing protein [Gammaproteobacteria bacterium]